MKSSYLVNRTSAAKVSESGARSTSLRHKILRPGLCTVVAAVGIFGGISALFAGLICVVIHEILSADVVYNQVGTTLLILAIPMILFGSIFLDEIRGTDA